MHHVEIEARAKKELNEAKRSLRKAEVENAPLEQRQQLAQDVEYKSAVVTFLTGSPCDLCAYNPPSSMDGKPCIMCPSARRIS